MKEMKRLGSDEGAPGSSAGGHAGAKILDIEAEMHRVGDFGTFQKRYFFFVCMGWLLAGAEVLQHAFAALRPRIVYCTKNCDPKTSWKADNGRTMMLFEYYYRPFCRPNSG